MHFAMINIRVIYCIVNCAAVNILVGVSSAQCTISLIDNYFRSYVSISFRKQDSLLSYLLKALHSSGMAES